MISARPLPIVAKFGREQRATVTRNCARKTEAGLEDARLVADAPVRHSSSVAPNDLAYIRAYLACIQYRLGELRNGAQEAWAAGWLYYSEAE